MSIKLALIVYHAYFDPVAHLSLSEAEKNQCERYIKNLILDDVYPQNRSSFDSTPAATSATTATKTITATTTVTQQLQQLVPQNKSLNASPYDEFIAACGDQDSILQNAKEKVNESVSPKK
ncbi:unnamed protein product [Rotaria magnacalcarata]|uniref:Uncharacterized protein n=2 Tax=Rotaria magnacalcarata TaxID=392030 RepID=A0A816BU85_9BILA|nr:unnamed protein product [Rotaria magnacalcarata]